MMAKTIVSCGCGEAMRWGNFGTIPPGWKCDFVEGDLGSGKTTLVQGIGEGLGITEPPVLPSL